MRDIVKHETADSTRGVGAVLSGSCVVLSNFCGGMGERGGDQRSHTYREFIGRQGQGGSQESSQAQCKIVVGEG